MSCDKDDPLAQLLAEFFAYLRDVRQVSPHTINNYRRDLDKLANWCRDHGHSDPRRLSQGDIRAWASSLHREGLAGTSIQRALSAARTLFNHLGRMEGMEHNPAAGVKAPRSPRKLPRTLDADQMGQFLDSSSDDPLLQRDLAMAELLYSSGLRLAELVSANIEDCDLAAGLITVTGKGNKTRTLPIGRLAITALKRWLDVRPATMSEQRGDRPLFTSSRGTRISRRSVQSRLQELGLKQGLAQRVHPHMLRHSFASHMLESSGDLRAVQELLGHANISTTQIYTHLDFQHLAKVYDAAHPRARRRKRNDEE